MMTGNSNALLVGLGLGWLTVALGLFLFFRIWEWWRRRRYGDPINHGLLLVEYERELTGVKHHQALDKVLTNELPHDLCVQRAALLLPDEHQLASVADEDFRLPISHAAVRWVVSGGEAQKANHNQLQKLIQQGRADLSWTQAWIPLMRGTCLQGMWLLGERQGSAQFSPEDLRCLTSIAREAAAVIEAMTFAEQERQTAIEMRVLYRWVITAREGERGRLTRELHDGVLQDLCAVTRELRALETQFEAHDPPYGPLVIR